MLGGCAGLGEAPLLRRYGKLEGKVQALSIRTATLVFTLTGSTAKSTGLSWNVS